MIIAQIRDAGTDTEHTTRRTNNNEQQPAIQGLELKQSATKDKTQCIRRYQPRFPSSVKHVTRMEQQQEQQIKQIGFFQSQTFLERSISNTQPRPSLCHKAQLVQYNPVQNPKETKEKRRDPGMKNFDMTPLPPPLKKKLPCLERACHPLKHPGTCRHLRPCPLDRGLPKSPRVPFLILRSPPPLAS